jgi:hypothetical protein
MRPNYAANLLALPDERLEAFVNDWLSVRTRDYNCCERWSGSGDMGRDVVGYVTENRHEGDWDNFQCKQLNTRLSEASAFLELGKIFMHAAAGEYSLPRAYIFVAPKGVVRNVQTFVAHPERFRLACKSKWNEFCAPHLVENKTIPLSPQIEAKIAEFNFKKLQALDASKLIDDVSIKPVLVRWFGDDPGEAPRGFAPTSVAPEESSYISQLVEAYGERVGTAFAGALDVLADPLWGDHLRDQRTRFFEAAAFKRHYRDSTFPDILDAFTEDIYHGVIETHRQTHPDTLTRVNEVMKEAKNVATSGVLAQYGRVPVKQGICHHFANEGRLPWKR